MRIVALEEHVAFASFSSDGARNAGPLQKYLEDVDELRLASMDAAGITVQVLSVPVPGAALAPPNEAGSFARRYNDEVAAAARRNAERFRFFAHLPLTLPEAAADELERTVRELDACGALISGVTQGKFLDDPMFDPILARAERLDVPIYVHPGIPPPTVRDAYYGGFSPDLSSAFATTGWGWHAETAVHVLRMVLAGTLDRHPNLKIIIGHMGEGLPTMLARCDERLTPKARHLSRPVAQTILDHVWITTSGFFTVPPFLAALLTFGADRILFSVDYPFSNNAEARTFLDTLPVAPDDKLKIAHRNADRLLKLQDVTSYVKRANARRR